MTARPDAAVAALLFALALAGCTSTNAPTAVSSNAQAPTTASVEMHNMAFDPQMTSVAVGGIVTWTNHDSVAHTVTPTDPKAWGTEGSGDDPSTWIQPGQSWSWTFSQAGAYSYSCIPHSSKDASGHWQGMTGVIHVG